MVGDVLRGKAAGRVVLVVGRQSRQRVKKAEEGSRAAP